MLNAVILAGAEAVKNWSGPDNKALFRINGKMMVEYVIEALRSVSAVGKISVVGPKEQLEAYLKGDVDEIVDSNDSIIDKVVSAVKVLGTDEKILVCCSDIPLITTEAINDFIQKAEVMDADFHYPIVEKTVNEEKYPEVERTYVKLREGTFTGGNLILIDPKVLGKAYTFAHSVLNLRKNPFGIARLLGPALLLRFLTGTLTIKRVEEKVAGITGIQVRAVISEYPEIGNDVDKPSDVIAATARLSE